MSLSLLADLCAEDSDSEDEEYIPEERVSGGSGCKVEGTPPPASEGGPLPRKKRKTLRSRKRRGGLQLEAGGRPSDSEKKMEEEEDEEEKEIKEKARIDDLWASFKQETTSFKPESKGKVSTGPATPSSPLKKKIKIQETYDFAGEEVKVEKEVDADSKEAKSFLKSEPEEALSKLEGSLKPEESSKLEGSLKPEESSKLEDPERLLSTDADSAPDFKSHSRPSSQDLLGKATVMPKVKSSGLSSVLKSLGKKPKMSTLDKTNLDWLKYKHDHGLEEELARHSKDGYLGKQDFLHRSDLRQFELEREERLKRFKRLH